MCAGGPSRRTAPATSTNASSRPIGSTMGVTSARTLWSSPLTSAYRLWRPDRKMASGQSWRARTDGMAECTP